MMIPTAPNPIALRIFDFPIYWYGIVMAFAIFAGFICAYKICKKFYPELNANVVYDMSLWLVLGAIAGARLYYVLLSWDFYSQNPSEIMATWHGGISIHGAIIGGALTAWIYLKSKKLSFLAYGDILTYGLVVGQIFGRLGNYFNQEAYGTPTMLPWKIYIEPFKRAEGFEYWQYFHPTFLYEMICNVIIFLVLFFIVRKIAKQKSGCIFFSYCIMYSVVRFFIEYLRLDSVADIFSMPVAQVASIIMLTIGISGLFFINRRKTEETK